MKRPLLFFMFLLVSTSAAQFGNDPKIIHLEPLVSVDRAVPGTRLEIALRVQVKKGYHINSNTPGADFLVPTALHFREQPHVEFFPVSYPQHRLMKFPFSDEKIAVYEGTFYLRSAVHLSDEFTHDSLYVSGELDYQGCDDYTCFAPTTLSFSKSVPVVEENSEIQFQHADVFDVALAKAPGLNTQLTNDEKRAQEILARGLPYAILAFFLFGLGLNLTPCVYPVIPMTVSYFGGAQTEGRLSA
ncbi:hypothetical protein JW992_09910, partial [candidate division KSB1 bacterium]|nr:hypothetical protein [candidate division KSB1 bacterium]